MKAIPGSRKRHYVMGAGIFLIAAVLVWAAIGCTKSLEEYRLTISSTDGGHVTEPGEGAFFYSFGTPETLTVTPDPGYQFVGWTGDVSRVTHPNSTTAAHITIRGDYSITAEFEKIQKCYLTVSATAGGHVAIPNKEVSIWDSRENVTLRAEKELGSAYKFVNWTGDVGTVANVNAASTKIRMDGNYSITANFETEAAVNITDFNLEAEVRKAIHRLEGPIYPSDLDGLSKLDAEGKNIADLTGLEYCTGLKELYLCRNQISNISALTNLARLTRLELGDNQVSNISALASLRNLTFLNLSKNPISDLRPLVENADFSQGDRVYLYDNPLIHSLLSSSDLGNYIAQLREKGVIVEY